MALEPDSLAPFEHQNPLAAGQAHLSFLSLEIGTVAVGLVLFVLAFCMNRIAAHDRDQLNGLVASSLAGAKAA